MSEVDEAAVGGIACAVAAALLYILSVSIFAVAPRCGWGWGRCLTGG